MNKSITFLIASFFFIFSTATSYAQDDLRTDGVNSWFEPDLPSGGHAPPSYYQNKKFVYVYREVIPLEVGGYTYFSILGANNGREFPSFYGGIQFYKDGSKHAIFSAWDVGSDPTCFTCLPGTSALEKQVSVWAKGPRTVARPFGNEGTGMNSMIHGFDWKLGQKVGMLASIEPAGTGSLISAAFKNGNEPWEFMTSFYVPSRYDLGMPGNYSFLEDWVGGDEKVPRSYLVGPTYLEDEDGNGVHFTNVIVYTYNFNVRTGDSVPNKHEVKVDGSWLRVRSGIPIQSEAKVEYRVQLDKPKEFPDISAGKALLEKSVAGKSTRYQEKLARLEAEAKVKADTEAKAAAERAVAEANAKAEAEAKAKLEAMQRAEAEAKAKLEAMQRAEAEAKAAAELEAKRVAKAQAKVRKKTITCTKGKKTKRVTAVNPKCPAGYKQN